MRRLFFCRFFVFVCVCVGMGYYRSCRSVGPCDTQEVVLDIPVRDASVQAVPSSSGSDDNEAMRVISELPCLGFHMP